MLNHFLSIVHVICIKSITFQNNRDQIRNRLTISNIREQLINFVSEWWFWNNQKEEGHFFGNVNPMY
jgi:hypothetical protein